MRDAIDTIGISECDRCGRSSDEHGFLRGVRRLTGTICVECIDGGGDDGR